MSNEKTLAAESPAPEQARKRTCPNCGTVHSEQELARAEYRCACGLELAYVETTPTGATRSVLGWLHRPGDRILERYRIEKVLGKGGFAATYLVEDLRLNGRKRAIKEIPELLYDETETEMLSHLSHPSVPDIIDRERVGDMVYLVLELGGGRTLENERRSRGGRIPLDTLLPWMRQLGEVIGYLHSQDPPIIHRDLKPDNVLLDDRDRIMLIDFGIAKQSAESGGTRTIARAATQGYSPPEQALGTGTDPRSDVYALAATAYSLLTGQVPPPAHERVAGVELKPPAQLVPEIPTAVSDTLVQALNLNINRRPATVELLLQPLGALTPPVTSDFTADTSHTLRVGDLPPEYTEKAASIRIHSERVTVAPTTAHRKRSRRGLWAFVGLVLAAAAGGLWFFQEPIREQLFPQEQASSKSSAGEEKSGMPETAQPALDGAAPSAAGGAPKTVQPATESVAPAAVGGTPEAPATAVRPPAQPPATVSAQAPSSVPATSMQTPSQAPVDTPTEKAATASAARAPTAVQISTQPTAAQSAASEPAPASAATAASSIQTPPITPPTRPGTFPQPTPAAQPPVAKNSAMSAFENRRLETIKTIPGSEDGAEATVVKTPSPKPPYGVEATVAKTQPSRSPKKKSSTQRAAPKKTVKKPAASGWSATYIGTKPKD